MRDNCNATYGWQGWKEVEGQLSLHAFVYFQAEIGKQELASILMDDMGEREQKQIHWDRSITLMNRYSFTGASWKSCKLC